MKSYRIFLPLFLLCFVAEQTTVEASSQTVSKKKSSNVSPKTAKKKTQKASRKKHSMSMYAKGIHPADTMLVNNFGKQVGFDPKDFSKVKEEEVCSKKVCKKDLDQSTCYRGFRGDIKNPEKGCQGYQRRSLGKNIGKVKKDSRVSSGGLVGSAFGTSKPGKKPGGKPTVDALDDGSLGLDVMENSIAGTTPVPGGTAPKIADGDPSTAIAGTVGAAAFGSLAIHNIADDDENTVPAGNGGIGTPAGTAGFASAGPGTALPAAVCSTQKDVETLGYEIKRMHKAELAGLDTAPIPGSEDPNASHTALYNKMIADLVLLATITDINVLNARIDILIGDLKIFKSVSSSYFSTILADNIMNAVTCIQNIGTPLEINERLGWLANAMAD